MILKIIYKIKKKNYRPRVRVRGNSDSKIKLIKNLKQKIKICKSEPSCILDSYPNKLF